LWVLCAGSVIVGGLADRPVVRTPMTSGAYTILSADFHVHSFPGDGALPPWEAAHEAHRRHLDVIGLTNHNAMLSLRLADALHWSPRDVLVIPGVEVTGVGFHVAAIGMHDPVPWQGTVVDAVRAIHAQGGVAIAAHPGGPYRKSLDTTAFQALDGIEAAHPAMFTAERARLEFAEVYRDALAAHPSIAAIGSSDFHTWAPIGLCRTYVFVRTPTADGVLEAIRAGRTVACDGQGATYGPAALSGIVRDVCRADASAPADGDGPLTRGSAIVAWLSLLALVLIGAREDVQDRAARAQALTRT
jgi:hypothetical protein